MVQFSPRWATDVYGPPPEGIKDSADEILFIHANLLKKQDTTSRRVIWLIILQNLFTKLTKYENQVQKNAAAEIIWANPMCLKLKPTIDDFPVKPIDIEFHSLHKDFDELFWNFTIIK